MMKGASLTIFAYLLLPLLLASCSLAPTYHRPTVSLTPTYKETGPWLKAKPKQHIQSCCWWKMYQDTTLNKLEDEVTLANQNIKAACARYVQAQAEAGVA